MKEKGLLMILSGPSGVGKDSVIESLMDRYSDYELSISITTRNKRQDEKEGVDYFFKSEEKFKKLIKEEGFLEYAYVHGNFYGTPKDFIYQKLLKGKNIILEIDVQGAMQVKENFSEAIFTFLLPPSMEELENRIKGRGTETEESFKLRMANAKKELALMEEYNYLVVNEKIEDAADDIHKIMEVEHLKTINQEKIIKDFKGV